MRYINANNSDVFTPSGPLEQELRLAESCPDQVVAVLRPWINDARRARIEDVLRHRTRTLAVAMEGVRDPHNIAAVIRSADAFGVQAVHIIENGNRFRSSGKVSQGTHKWVDIGVWSQPADFAAMARSQGKRILYAAADANQSIGDLDPLVPTVVVFGNEHEGITPAMRELSDGSFGIPMHGFVESLNISVAASLTLYALRRDGDGDLEERDQQVLRARYYLRAVSHGLDLATSCDPGLASILGLA